DDGRPGLAQMAMDAVTSNRVNIVPPRYAKSYLDWLSEKRDWPVSRQLWWGHRIPVWSAPMNPHDSGELVANESDESYLKRKKAELRAWDEQLKKWESEGRLAFSRRESSDVISTVKEDRPYWFFCIRDEHDVEIATALEQRGYSQEPDVLDTWFSSA